MESILENLPMILAVALALSEALAMIPALKENSILQLAMRVLRKGKELFPKQEETKKIEEEKKEDDK